MWILGLFGDRVNTLILVLFILSFFLLNSLLFRKSWRLVFAIFGGVFISSQMASLFFTQSFIGYQFYTHLSLRGVVGISGLFIPHVIGMCVFLPALIFLLFSANRIFYRKVLLKLENKIRPLYFNLIILLLVGVAFAIILIKGSLVSDSKTLISMLRTNPANFEQVLDKHGLNGYVSPQEVRGKAGKNIIILSLESLERGYMSGKFSSLTPNLQKLKNKWRYYDLKQNGGSEWTSGSLYTYLTGFPAYFGLDGNDIFQKAYHSEISSISHVLKKANYQTTYLSCNTDHSGVKEMLNMFDFDKVIDYKNVEKSGYESTYGIRDKDLFDLAKVEIENLAESQKSFALFISTMDTHFPNGIYDERMESTISPKKSDLEFMVAALDHMVGDFIDFLEKKSLMDNTSIYIFPDHLKMGDPTMFEGTGERGLYLITNVGDEMIPINRSVITYQIDLGKIILKGADIEHNLKFLTDYIEGDKNEYIKENLQGLTEINTSGILRLN